MSGAPEIYLHDSFMVGRTVQNLSKADVWSLGAIYSVALTWVTLGPHGVEDYRKQRIEATRKNGIQDKIASMTDRTFWKQ